MLRPSPKRLNCSTLNQNHVQQMPTAIKTQSSLCSLFSFHYRFCVTMANKSKQDAINKLTPLFFSSSSSVGLHGQTDLCPYSCISCRLWGCMLSLTLDELETIIPVEYCNFTTMPSDSRANYRSTMSVSITPWVLTWLWARRTKLAGLFLPEVMPFGMWHASARF